MATPAASKASGAAIPRSLSKRRRLALQHFCPRDIDDHEVLSRTYRDFCRDHHRGQASRLPECGRPPGTPAVDTGIGKDSFDKKKATAKAGCPASKLMRIVST
jgi:hypothetical protein